MSLQWWQIDKDENVPNKEIYINEISQQEFMEIWNFEEEQITRPYAAGYININSVTLYIVANAISELMKKQNQQNQQRILIIYDDQVDYMYIRLGDGFQEQQKHIDITKSEIHDQVVKQFQISYDLVITCQRTDNENSEINICFHNLQRIQNYQSLGALMHQNAKNFIDNYIEPSQSSILVQDQNELLMSSGIFTTQSAPIGQQSPQLNKSQVNLQQSQTLQLEDDYMSNDNELCLEIRDSQYLIYGTNFQPYNQFGKLQIMNFKDKLINIVIQQQNVKQNCIGVLNIFNWQLHQLQFNGINWKQKPKELLQNFINLNINIEEIKQIIPCFNVAIEEIEQSKTVQAGILINIIAQQMNLPQFMLTALQTNYDNNIAQLIPILLPYCHCPDFSKFEAKLNGIEYVTNPAKLFKSTDFINLLNVVKCVVFDLSISLKNDLQTKNSQIAQSLSLMNQNNLTMPRFSLHSAYSNYQLHQMNNNVGVKSQFQKQIGKNETYFQNFDQKEIIQISGQSQQDCTKVAFEQIFGYRYIQIQKNKDEIQEVKQHQRQFVNIYGDGMAVVPIEVVLHK